MLDWEIKHPAPVTIMLITDSDVFHVFCSSLPWLQEYRKCNILLAYQDALKGDYSLLSHEPWYWKSLLKDAKCSETVDFSCIVCRFVCRSSEEVTKHLKGEEHALHELGLKPRRDKKQQPKRKSKMMMVEAGADTSHPKRKKQQPKRKSKMMMVEAGADSSHPKRKKQQLKRKAKKMKMTYEHQPQDHE